MDKEQIIKNMIKNIGDNPEREGLIDTPKRVIKSWSELYSGYNKKPEDILKTTFSKEDYNEMVILKNIEFYSMCEHHILPFYGIVNIGYIPNKKIVGISKLARLVEVYCRRLQIQERLTTQIADIINKIVEPIGVIVVVKAKHLCMLSRGIKQHNTEMITSALRGIFEKDEKTRTEFMRLTNE